MKEVHKSSVGKKPNIKKAIKQFILTFLSKLGYLLAAGEGLLVLAVDLPSFMDSAIGKSLIPKSHVPPKPVIEPVAVSPPPAVVIVLGVALSVFLVGLVIYVLIMRYIPTTTQLAQTIVKKVALQAVPIVAHEPLEHIAPKKRRYLTARIMWWLKVCLAVFPVVGVGALYIYGQSLGRLFVVCVEAGLASFVLISFTAHALLARRWHIVDIE